MEPEGGEAKEPMGTVGRISMCDLAFDFSAEFWCLCVLSAPAGGLVNPEHTVDFPHFLFAIIYHHAVMPQSWGPSSCQE